MKAGFYRVVETPKGSFALPESISFGNMDDTKFEKVYEAVLEQIILDTKADREFIEQELINFF